MPKTNFKIKYLDQVKELETLFVGRDFERKKVYHIIFFLSLGRANKKKENERCCKMIHFKN